MIRLATMTSVCPDWTIDEVIDGMKRHGYSGLEPRVEWGHASGIEVGLSKAQRRSLKRRFAEEGLYICCLATGVRMATADIEERTRHIEDLRRFIELASDLDCPLIRTFGGPHAEGLELPLVVDYTAAGYRQIIPDAEGANVTVLMETHDAWCNSAGVAAVVNAVDHPNLRVLWDFMHPQRRCERPADTFSTIGALTRHTHAHDGTYVDGQIRVGELGAGVIDHLTPLQLLHGIDFDGYFSVEVIHKPGSQHDADGVLAQYAAEFRALLEQL